MGLGSHGLCPVTGGTRILELVHILIVNAQKLALWPSGHGASFRTKVTFSAGSETFVGSNPTEVINLFLPVMPLSGQVK